MTEVEPLFERFKDEVGSFLLKVQTVRVLDRAAFERLDADARGLAQKLKFEALVPKSILNEMNVTKKLLRAEASFMGDEKGAMIAMADKLDMTFDLILLGEDHGDRIPGKPRIV